MPSDAPEINPGEFGNCAEEACPQYDGKRCKLTGFSARAAYTCEPGWERLREDLATARRTRDDAQARAGELLTAKRAAEAERGEAERGIEAAQERGDVGVQNVRTQRDAMERERDALAARLKIAEAILRDMEWNAWDAGTGNSVCVECAWDEPKHKPGCRLHAFLAPPSPGSAHSTEGGDAPEPVSNGSEQAHSEQRRGAVKSGTAERSAAVPEIPPPSPGSEAAAKGNP